MAHFIISYDLRNQRNYQPLWDTLENWGATRLLESLWVVSMNSSAPQIRDALKQVIDADDALVVIQLQSKSGWATLRALNAGVNWLKQNILP